MTVTLLNTEKANAYTIANGDNSFSCNDGQITKKLIDYSYTDNGGRTVFANGDTADKLPNSDKISVTLADGQTKT